MNKCKIYILTDPEGEVRYVGKTTGTLGRRLLSHIRQARNGTKGHKCSWIRSLLKESKLPEIKLVTEVNGDGSKEEIEYIDLFRSSGKNLTNMTDGGEGTLGFSMSPSIEHRQKLSKSLMGHAVDMDTRKKISASKMGSVPWNKGKNLSERHTRMLRESHLGNKHTIETRRRMSASRMGRIFTEETRDKIGRANKEAWRKRKLLSEVSNA